MNMLDVNNVKWIEDSIDDIKKISEKIDAAGVVTSTHTEDAVVSESVADAEPKTAFAKMKAFVRKAVDCCIE